MEVAVVADDVADDGVGTFRVVIKLLEMHQLGHWSCADDLSSVRMIEQGGNDANATPPQQLLWFPYEMSVVLNG